MVFRAMDNMLSNQITEVKASFENSLGFKKLFHHGMLFQDIKGHILHLTLNQEGEGRSIEIGLDPSVCDHFIYTIYGLPCTHELLQYSHKNQPIPLEDVD